MRYNFIDFPTCTSWAVENRAHIGERKRKKTLKTKINITEKETGRVRDVMMMM